jgi:hypothetical protein
LSKKLDNIDVDNGELPTSPPEVTSKSEVFFVKYKTQQEAERAISQIQQSYKDGTGYKNPANFTQSLGVSPGIASSRFSTSA